MKFIILNGCSCSGKSTVVNRIIAEQDDFYKLSYDTQKWPFSRYDRNKHFVDVKTIVHSLAETVCAMQKYNVICDSALYKDDREELLAIAKKHGYETIEVNLETDYAVLEKRFDERVALVLAGKSKATNTSKERFRELYELYQAGKNPLATTLETNLLDADETYEKVIELTAPRKGDR